MNRRQLRARLLLEEARILGVDVADLVAAATAEPALVTVEAWITEIAPTFTQSTAATSRRLPGSPHVATPRRDRGARGAPR